MTEPRLGWDYIAAKGSFWANPTEGLRIDFLSNRRLTRPLNIGSSDIGCRSLS